MVSSQTYSVTHIAWAPDVSPPRRTKRTECESEGDRLSQGPCCVCTTIHVNIIVTKIVNRYSTDYILGLLDATEVVNIE